MREIKCGDVDGKGTRCFRWRCECECTLPGHQHWPCPPDHPCHCVEARERVLREQLGEVTDGE